MGMNELSNWSKHSIVLLLIASVIYSFGACKGSKESLDEVTTSKSRNKKAGKSVMLLYSDNLSTNAAYEDIKGNIPRLKAMMSGRFVTYNTTADSARKVYSAWKVNEGKDSVMIYQLPIGDPNKDGHWMYSYQYMTSLPEDPVYESFFKMTEINRDSIVAIYYEVPKDFTATIPQILAKPTEVFRDFPFESLEPSKTGEVVYYKRKTPLHYVGISRLLNTGSKIPEREGGYDADYYIIKPELYSFGTAVYNREKKFLGRTQGTHLMKEAGVQLQFIGR